MYLIAITFVAAGSILYHLSSRSIDVRVRPTTALVLTYGLALILVAGLALAFDRNDPRTFMRSATQARWAPVGLAIGAVLIEFGYIVAYRHGGRLASSSVTATATTSALLAGLGVLWFGERLSIRMAVGIAAALLAVILLSAE